MTKQITFRCCRSRKCDNEKAKKTHMRNNRMDRI